MRDRDLRIALPEEPHALGRSRLPDGLREEPLEAVAHHAPHALRRERGHPEAGHRERERVADRGVAVDQRAVQVEDEEGAQGGGCGVAG